MNNRITSDKIEQLEWKQIFVFGSNEAGLHGAGAAHVARSFGAELGVGFGLQGSTFALPTKDWNIQPLPLDAIKFYVSRFEACVPLYPDLTFLVTRVGCGLAGYTPLDIAPMFQGCMKHENVHLPQEFWNLLLL